MPDMETRVEAVEHDVADMKMTIIRFTNALLGMQEKIDGLQIEIRDGFHQVNERIDRLAEITENGFAKVGFISPKDD